MCSRYYSPTLVPHHTEDILHSASSGDVSHNQFSFLGRTIKLIQDSDLESDESVNKVNEFEFL